MSLPLLAIMCFNIPKSAKTLKCPVSQVEEHLICHPDVFNLDILIEISQTLQIQMQITICNSVLIHQCIRVLVWSYCLEHGGFGNCSVDFIGLVGLCSGLSPNLGRPCFFFRLQGQHLLHHFQFSLLYSTSQAIHLVLEVVWPCLYLDLFQTKFFLPHLSISLKVCVQISLQV